MPEYIYNDKTGLYYLASKVISDNYYGAPLNRDDSLKMFLLEKEFESEIEQARLTILFRDDLKKLDYYSLLNYCAELLLRLRLENKKSEQVAFAR